MPLPTPPPKPSTLPYASKNGGPPQTRRSVVALLDILGFTAEIRTAHEKGESDQLLQRFHRAVDEWWGSTGVLRRDRGSVVKTLTDNIVIATPFSGYQGDPDGEVAVSAMLSGVALLQCALIEEGFISMDGNVEHQQDLAKFFWFIGFSCG